MRGQCFEVAHEVLDQQHGWRQYHNLIYLFWGLDDLTTFSNFQPLLHYLFSPLPPHKLGHPEILEILGALEYKSQFPVVYEDTLYINICTEYMFHMCICFLEEICFSSRSSHLQIRSSFIEAPEMI